MKRYRFSTFYWDKEKSTKVKFQPLKRMPILKVMACMVVVFVDNDTVAIARPKRGWGLPGGHIEKGETPQQAAIREVYEETAVVIKDVRIVGGWLAEKLFGSALNKDSPKKSYQLLFVAKAERVDEFVNKFEIMERAFVPASKLTEYITSNSFAEIYNYLRHEHFCE